MGAGNVRVNGDYEGLFYVRWDNFNNTSETDNGKIVEDYDRQRMEWEDALSLFTRDLKNKFPSLYDCDEWLDRREHAFLENGLFYITTEDNQWSMAIKLIQKEQKYFDSGNIVNLQAGLYMKYLEGIKECLFNQFEELGTYAGPWTSGTIKKGA